MPTVLLAAAIGLLLGSALGLLGGGGGILAVPMLVGLLGMDVDQAATASLVIVLFGALGGLASHHRAGRVLWRSGLLFGVVSMAGGVLGAVLATRVDDWIKLSAFAALMVVAGLAMLRNARSQPADVAPQARLVAGRTTGPRVPTTRSAAQGRAEFSGREQAASGVAMAQPAVAEASARNPGDDLIDAPTGDRPVAHRRAPGVPASSILLLVVLATGTGLVTGFLGVGGGFLVVPALVLSARMPIPNATATGLVVIAIASLSALAVRLTHADALLEPALTAAVVPATIGASLVAARFSGRLSPRVLATGFAFLVLGMSVLVAAQAAEAIRTS